MSTTFRCDDKDTLIEYLYGELDTPARRAVEAHLAVCAACAAEVSALGDVRAELGAWAAPDAELGFTIVKKADLPSNVVRPARWWSTVPAWAQAAAAVLVVAAGASIANLRITSGPDGVSVSTGWMTPRVSPISTSAAPDESWKPALASLEQQLRGEIKASVRAPEVRTAAAATGTDDATIRRVQQLISESEQRHSRELAARLIEFQRDVNMQRRADLMNINSVIGNTVVDYDRRLLQQRQLLNNVMRVSNPQ